MSNVIRLIFGNANTLIFAAVAIVSLVRRTGLMRRLWRWLWS